jgi:hypothetical protein
MERQSDWCMIISRLCHVARFQKQSIYPSSITHSKKKKDFQTDIIILWFHLFSLGYQFSWINRAVVRIVVDTWVFVVLKLIHNFFGILLHGKDVRLSCISLIVSPCIYSHCPSIHPSTFLHSAIHIIHTYICIVHPFTYPHSIHSSTFIARPFITSHCPSIIYWSSSSCPSIQIGHNFIHNVHSFIHPHCLSILINSISPSNLE